MKKLLIGAHLSTAGGLEQALLRGKEIGATTAQIFTSNQKQWNGRSLSPDLIELWKEKKEETGLQKIMSHDSFLINLGSYDEEILSKSRRAFHLEIQRCHQLEIDFLNFHPGVATLSNTEDCMKRIIESLLLFEEVCASGKTRLLLETTAGQGNAIGYRFEHLAFLLDQLKGKLPLGVCIDTCHIFVAGYDIRTKEAWERTLQKFDEIIGLKHLYAFHLNDSIKPLGSRTDRHAPLGKGEIGIEAFQYVMQNPALRDIPKYLETPEPDLWKEEIALLRSFIA